MQVYPILGRYARINLCALYVITNLTPIVYTKTIDDVLLAWIRIGQIILVEGNPRAKAPRSYCGKCHTGYQSEVPLDNLRQIYRFSLRTQADKQMVHL
jgi:hypothetical protein